MKTNVDLVKGWLQKANSDIANVKMCLSAEQALDTACFHAQQAAERSIKAYLTAKEIDFPFIHNLEKLIELCAKTDPAFLTLKGLCEDLTPYAVGLRYDNDFWPSKETAQQALEAALAIYQFVIQRLANDLDNSSATFSNNSETPLD